MNGSPPFWLYVIEPTVFKDERGYFVETYNHNDFREAGLDMVFVQDNQSMSCLLYTSKTGGKEAVHAHVVGI